MSDAPRDLGAQQAGSQPVAVGAGVATGNEKTMGMLCHLLAFAGFLIPFGHIIGPLVIWLMKKDDMPFVASQGKESLNFQITVTIATVVSIVLVIVLIGFLLLMAVVLIDIILVIMACIATSRGEPYRYPIALRLIK